MAKWRTLLKIDPKWDLPVKCGADDDGEEDSLAVTDLDQGEYFKAEITLCPKLTDDKDRFDKEIEATIIHELLHVVLWPLGSFLWNATGNKDIAESNKVEEIVVSHLEKVIAPLVEKSK